ncbi:MAG: outer membrane protein assembly factor BamE, partial [Janthinobacterium lividum]
LVFGGFRLSPPRLGSWPTVAKPQLLLTSFTFVGLLALAGCSFPGVYKIDIQQGNVVTQDMIDQLRPGMTRRQVRFIMGNPLLTDTFHPERWDYLYSLQPGGGERQQERVSLIFNGNDQLASLSGDFKPGVSRDEAILGKGSDTTVTPENQGTEPPKEEPPKPGSLLEQIQNDVDKVETVPIPSQEPLDTNPR